MATTTALNDEEKGDMCRYAGVSAATVQVSIGADVDATTATGHDDSSIPLLPTPNKWASASPMYGLYGGMAFLRVKPPEQSTMERLLGEVRDCHVRVRRELSEQAADAQRTAALIKAQRDALQEDMRKLTEQMNVLSAQVQACQKNLKHTILVIGDDDDV